MRARPIRPNVYMPVTRFGVRVEDWKFVLAAVLISYTLPFLLNLKLLGVPLELWGGVASGALSIAFFNFVRIGRRPFWLQHRLRAGFSSPVQRRALPADRQSTRPWITAD